MPWRVSAGRGLAMADEAREWDADAARARVREWAGGDKRDWTKYGRAFLLVEAPGETDAAYRLPFADVVGGELLAVPRGIVAASGALQGARGGVEAPEAIQDEAREVLGAYYQRLKREPPWGSRSGDDGAVERRLMAGPVELVAPTAGEKAAGQLTGYAAVFYRAGESGTEYALTDRVRERILPGAFKAALARGDDVLALYQHDTAGLLGRSSAKTLRLLEDEKGLRYEIDIPDTTAGRDVAEYVRRGDVRGSSFGFRADEQRWTDLDGGKRLREVRSVRLLDVGPVVQPAYWGTSVSVRALAVSDQVRAESVPPPAPARSPGCGAVVEARARLLALEASTITADGPTDDTRAETHGPIADEIIRIFRSHPQAWTVPESDLKGQVRAALGQAGIVVPVDTMGSTILDMIRATVLRAIPGSGGMASALIGRGPKFDAATRAESRGEANPAQLGAALIIVFRDRPRDWTADRGKISRVALQILRDKWGPDITFAPGALTDALVEAIRLKQISPLGDLDNPTYGRGPKFPG